MTLTHYSLKVDGVEFSLDDVPYQVSATDALHLMNLILHDQLKLQLMLLEAQYPRVSSAVEHSNRQIRRLPHDITH